MTGMALAHCILGKFLGGSLPLLSPAFRRFHFLRQVSVRPQRREISWQRKVELWARNCPVILPKFRLPLKFRDFFTCLKSTTWDRGLYFSSEGRRAEDFFTLKIRRLRPGLNPRTSGTKGQHAIPRPLIFGRNPFRISSATATVLNETLRGISQSLQDSAVGIANTQRDILPDVRIPLWEKSFCFLQSVQNCSRSTQLSIQWVPGLFPGVERPRHAYDRSPPSTAEFKNEGICTSVPPTHLREVEREMQEEYFKKITALSFIIISYLLFTIIHLLDALFSAVTSSLIYSIFRACK